MLRLVDNVRRKQLAWMQAIYDETGWKQSELARRGGFSHATLSRFKNDANNSAKLDTDTVAKILAVSPIPHYENSRAQIPQGFTEREAEPIREDTLVDLTVARMVTAAKVGQNAVDAWVLHNRAIENLGYLPGDIVMVDLNAKPEAGDVVCAQVFDRMGNPETAFRVYYPPYLMGASNERIYLRPIPVDDRVLVRGVVIASIRPRLRLAS